MKKSVKRVSIISIVVIVMVCMSAVGIYLTSKYIDSKGSSQSDYVIPPDQEAFVSFINFNNLDELTRASDLVITGIVCEVLPQIDKLYNPARDTAESAILAKMGQTGFRITKHPVKIAIIDTLKGNSESSEIILYRSSITIDMEPELLIGKKLVFFWRKIQPVMDI